MNFAAIYHRSIGQMCYACSENELVVNLKTGRDIDRAFIIYDDPYGEKIDENWQGHRVEILCKKYLENHIWWTVTIIPKSRRLKYYFELVCGREVWNYCSDGFLDCHQRELRKKSLSYFIMPWMHSADLDTTPNWASKTVWYQIFVDRFYRSKNSLKSKDILEWREDETVTNEERFGGNLKGITEKLGYLSDLGINGIYLTPICESETIHGYHTTDYSKINQHFGTENDMKELVKEAHRLGMRVMMDGVFNHCGQMFKPWQNALKRGPASKYFDWFMFNKWPVDIDRDTRDNRFYSFAYAADMPKLNTDNEKVISYLEKICLSWIKLFDIDGIRFDAGNEISHYCIKQIRHKLKSVRPDIYLVGEIWHNASQWLDGDEFDAVTNYPLADVINNVFLDENLTKFDFEYKINDCYTRYKRQHNRIMLNMLDSHDTIRLINRSNDIGVFIQQLATLFTMPGSPCIYYGTEIALEGMRDPDCRRCMPWKNINKGQRRNCRNLICKLIKLRRNEPLFSSMHFCFTNVYKESRMIEYIKFDKMGNQLEILMNACDRSIYIGSGNSNILFAHRYLNNVLSPGGTLIRKK